MKRTFKTGVIVGLLMLMLLAVSCGKKEKVRQTELNKEINSLLTEENLGYLENTIDYMEGFTFIKRLDISFNDLTAKPDQYKITGDRQTQLIKFGMLVSDMAFLKIVMGSTQIPEYDALFERYVKELNVSSFLRNYFDEYKEILANEEITDEVFADLKLKFRQDRKDLIANAKELDEDFLIYFTIGTFLEGNYLLIGIDSESGRKSISAFNDYLKESGAPALKLMRNIWNHTGNTNHKIINEYGKLLKPVFDIRLKNFNESSVASAEEFHIIKTNLDEVRKQILK